MRRGDIIKYTDLASAEGQQLQRGMNFTVSNKPYSVVLMSVRPGAPYDDEIKDGGRTIIYEGHDMPDYKHLKTDPKTTDQPLVINGTLTENGKFAGAALAYKSGKADYRLVKAYEKIKSGIWVYNGFFKLADAYVVIRNGRNVCKFRLEMIEDETDIVAENSIDFKHDRLIPTEVKVKVYARDKGCCVLCGSKENLHFDHDLPFSKGGTSKLEDNIQLLCAKCNLSKNNKII